MKISGGLVTVKMERFHGLGTRIAEEEMLLKGVFQVENNRSAVKRHMNEQSKFKL